MNGRAGGLRRRRRSERLRLPRRAVLPSRASVPRRCAGFGDAAAERDALRDAPGARPRGDARDGARSVARIVSLGLRAVAALALAGHRRQVVLVPVGVAAVEPRQHPAPHILRVDHVVEDGAAGRRECPASELTDVQPLATQIRPPPLLSFRSFDLGCRLHPKPDFTFKTTVNFESSRVINLHFVYQITYQSQNDS